MSKINLANKLPTNTNFKSNLANKLPINTNFKSNLFQNNISKLVLNKKFFHSNCFNNLQKYNSKKTFIINKKFYCQTNQKNISTMFHNLNNNQKILKIIYNTNFITNMWLSCNIGNYVITHQHITFFGAVVTMFAITFCGAVSISVYLDNLPRRLNTADLELEFIISLALIFIILIIILFCYFDITFNKNETFIKLLDKYTK